MPRAATTLDSFNAVAEPKRRQVLETDPHSRVRESATAVIEDAEREIAALERLLAGLA